MIEVVVHEVVDVYAPSTGVSRRVRVGSDVERAAGCSSRVRRVSVC